MQLRVSTLDYCLQAFDELLGEERNDDAEDKSTVERMLQQTNCCITGGTALISVRVYLFGQVLLLLGLASSRAHFHDLHLVVRATLGTQIQMYALCCMSGFFPKILVTRQCVVRMCSCACASTRFAYTLFAFEIAPLPVCVCFEK